MVELKNYICLNPYKILEIHEWFNGLCVPEWLLKYIPSDIPLENVWNGDIAKELRESVSDGSFKYCDKSQCPYLEYLLKYGYVDNMGPIIHKSNLKPGFLDSPYPYRIDLDFDRTCNYKCPSCRKNVYTADNEKIDEISKKIDEVVKVFGKGVKELYLSASGDPLVSLSYRKFLQNFNSDNFPMLESIHLHTNASLWNKKIWDSMSNVHKYVKTCEISIDASSKETYENKVRLNGNWDNLIKNLKFISTIKGLRLVKPSFVVQQKNYKEMYDFAQLMKSIFGNKVLVLFIKMNNWGTFNEEEFLNEKIWDKSHPEHSDFLIELNRIKSLTHVYHNMHDLLNEEKTIL